MESYHTDLTMATASTSTENNVSHKLRYKWNLWAHLPQDPDWTVKSYKKIYQFKTVEEAIGITESLPADLVKNCMLFIMRDSITPMWEDSKNSTNSIFVNCVTGITISPKKNFCIVKIWMTNCDHQNPQIVTSDIRNLTPQGCLFKKHTPEF